MKIKLLSIFVCTLLFTIPFSITVLAGSEEDPEIVDETDENVMKYLDIISAWFFEEENQPDYLFISLKLKEINPYQQ